jgi:hypothetical protein
VGVLYNGTLNPARYRFDHQGIFSDFPHHWDAAGGHAT